MAKKAKSKKKAPQGTSKKVIVRQKRRRMKLAGKQAARTAARKAATKAKKGKITKAKKKETAAKSAK